MSSSKVTFTSFRSRRSMLIVVLICISAVVVLAADPVNPLAKPKPAGADAGTPAAAATSLTIEQIGDALECFNKNSTTINGHTEYGMTIHKGKWDMNVIVSLSPSGRVIWITNGLATIPKNGKVPAAALLNILAKNTEIGPQFFSIANGSLRLSNPVSNFNLTAAGLRAQVEALVATVVETADLWKPETLGSAAAAADAPAPSEDRNPLSK